MTTYLAAVLGWYLVIVSLFLLFRQDYVRSIMSDILMQRAFIFILGIITLILGLLMVVGHNIWVMGWPVIITLIAWVTVVSGILRLVFPEMAIKMGQGMMSKPAYLNIASVIFLVLGLFLLYKVYV